jgi:methionine-gamma-lyase
MTTFCQNRFKIIDEVTAMEHDDEKLGPATKSIHSLRDGKGFTFHPVNTPIYASSTFSFPTVDHGAKIFAGESGEFAYGRLKNPTVSTVEYRLALLEGADDSILFGSGMAAITTFILSIVKKGDHIIVDPTLYGGTHSFITHKLPELGIDVSFVEMSNPENIRKEIRPNTKLIYFESITNPTLRVIPIRPISEIGKQYGITTAVDATFMSPILQRPIEMGIDVVIHSATKYLNGHSDILAGVVSGPQELMDECRMTSVHYGGILGPFEAYLLGRGLKTLKIRIMEHEKNTKIIADYLAKNDFVKTLIYLGHENHPQHELAKSQQEGFSSMVTFELDGDFEMAKYFVNSLELFTRAVSLGGVETLISHPASTTHNIVSEEDRAKSGISDTLMRVSVGIEDPEDLIRDLDQAFTKLRAYRQTLLPEQ